MSLEQQVIDFFKSDGILSKKFKDYEFRQSQLDMALELLKTLQNKSHVMIEAPTGVGKSFAYLVPSILYAKANKKKAVISTHTINLQEQLLYKDIPLLNEIMPVNFKAALIKGKTNYLCPKRLQTALVKSDNLFDSDEQLFLDKVYSWSLDTIDGTISDLPIAIKQNVWNSICAERGICSTKTCGGMESDCFYMKAKLEVADSDVVIVNHHLFFTLFDGVSEADAEGYLFINDFVVFDEAHTLESIAAEHIYPALSREAIKYQLNRLYNPNKKKGFLLNLPSLHIQLTIQNLFDLVHRFFFNLKEELFIMNNGRYEKLAVRVYEKNIVEDILTSEIEKLLEYLRELRKNCKDDMELNELNDFIIRFGEIKYYIKNFLEQKYEEKRGNEFVYWVELSGLRDDSNVSICTAPIDISDYFKENIFRENNSTVLTSATLTVNNNFDYFKERLGAEDINDMILPTQFNFFDQVKIYIPTSMPPPSKNSDIFYTENLKDWILHFIEKTGGKALVLFTNMGLMKQIGNELRTVVNESDIEILIQGEGNSRSNLLKKFKDNTNSVLFGVDSFWVGIDVPGESLSNLIITKLPFQVPDHPVVKARMEFIDARGGNSFMEYSLPEAILKFRQGVGRLIRNSNDKGIIAILDNRILTKPYGKYFLNSIEKCPIERI
ncbi:MAG TPA: helicase C-terminal domain-containing protein [Ignavibacteria bacterium]|nr:helicase C-terminal domain-containing protein [Ignavibacteria bacterium]